MKTILFIIQKEFIQIFRNKTMLPIIFVLPIIQLLILVHAATFEMKNIDLIVQDNDNSQISRGLISKLEGSPFFNIVGHTYSPNVINDALFSNDADIAIVIPSNMEKELMQEKHSSIQLQVNAIDGVVAGLSNSYLSAILQDYNINVVLNEIMPMQPSTKSIGMKESFWYNPELDYKSYMVPGILVLLVTLIGMFLSGMNLVREKEIGTIEQINVTPIKKYQFITGKLVPFLIIALFELSFGLIVGVLLFDVPIRGSLLLIFGVATIYLVLVLGLGLFMSTISSTQQQAMFISFFFIMIFILMSGLFTDVSSMPHWAIELNRINPIAYFIKILRVVLLKGSELRHIKTEVISLIVYAVCILGVAIMRYRKTA